MLRHSELAYTWGLKKDHAFVIENGRSVLFNKKEAHLGEPVDTGRVFVDETNSEEIIILNEGADAPEVLRKIAALVLSHAAYSYDTHQGTPLGDRWAWVCQYLPSLRPPPSAP